MSELRRGAMSLGEFIAAKRKALGLSQRQLAQLVRKGDGSQISPQYLNDIELGRRNPASDHLLEQFAQRLAKDADDDVLDQLYFLAGQLPPDIRGGDFSPQEGADAMKAFRKTLHKGQ